MDDGTNAYQDWNLEGAGNWSNTYRNGGASETRTHSDFNEIVDRTGAATLAHDRNGNLTDDGSTVRLKWDVFGRLREARRRSDNVLVATYLYDTDNRRMRKIVSAGGVAQNPDLNGTTDYYYDAWRVMEEHETRTGLGTDVLMRQYTYGNYLDEVWTVDRRNYLGDPVPVSALNDGEYAGDYFSERMFCHSNTLYSVCGLTDERQTDGGPALREAYQYDAYGAPTRISDDDNDLEVRFDQYDARTPNAPSDFSNPYLFTGQRFDPETGLMFMKHRYYGTGVGRFISRDPAMIPDGRSAFGGAYGYSLHGPTMRTDPLGLFEIPLPPLPRELPWPQIPWPRFPRKPGGSKPPVPEGEVCKCGPDITSQLISLLARINTEFRAQPRLVQGKRCGIQGKSALGEFDILEHCCPVRSRINPIVCKDGPPNS